MVERQPEVLKREKARWLAGPFPSLLPLWLLTGGEQDFFCSRHILRKQLFFQFARLEQIDTAGIPDPHLSQEIAVAVAMERQSGLRRFFAQVGSRRCVHPALAITTPN